MREPQLSTPNAEFYGICNMDTYEIIVGYLENKQKMRLTFIHELVHAIIFSHMLKKEKHYTEEEIAELVAKYWDTMRIAIEIWDYNAGGYNDI